VMSSDILDVLPDVGHEHFRDRGPSPTESSADFAWCLYAD
jgi:hypothetical protein